MKKTLLFLLALVAGFSINKAHATHDIGGSLTYQCVAPGIYVFTYSHYNWGGLAAVPQNMNLIISSPGCSITRQVAFNPGFNSSRIGGYIPPTHGVSHYMITDMVGVATFTPAEQACGNVVVNVSIGTGQPAANLSQPGGGGVNQFTEATVNLNFAGNLGASQNNSPIFDFRNEPVLVAAKFQPITLSVAASDQDGDSLVYRLVAPITGHNQPITNYGVISGPFVNPTPQMPFVNPGNPQVATLPGTTAYSADFPLLSYYANWSAGQQTNVAQKNFILNPQSGHLSFTPMLYNTNNNVYLVSFQVDEYRKVNGTQTKIGSIRRETIIIVGDPAGNINPNLNNILVNNAPATPNSVYDVAAGTPFTLQVSAFDANTSDSVYLASNAALEFPGATFTVSSGNQPTGTFSWTPPASAVRDQLYFLRIWVRDNASPLAAKRVETFAFRVTNTGGVMGIKPEVNGANFFAYPNPFTQEVSFRLTAQSKAREIIIYNLLGQQVDHLNIANAAKNADLMWTNAAKYPAGAYVARLVSEDKTIRTIKFTKAQ